MKTVKVMSLSRYKDKVQIELQFVPGRLERLCGIKSKTITVRGCGTVWHHLPSFKRCSTRMESLLADLYEKHVD